MNDKLIQAISLCILLVGLGVGGRLLPVIIDSTEEHGLRYTDISVEGAPPFVAIGTAIGALRGLIVDYLWIKVHIQQEKGLFYEVMADAELITKLQPRFASVWAFQGHNMAYNISVACHTQAERWEWVQAGIRLVQNEGLRYNPNDLDLHKELAFWYAHKIEGYSDDAHIYYKREFCREWHYLLGPPPDDLDERIAWIKKLADAPNTLESAELRTPGVKALVDRINSTMSVFSEQMTFTADREFLRSYGLWKAVKEQSEAAQLLGMEQDLRSGGRGPSFVAFDALATDPKLAAAWDTLIAYVRRRVLIDEYNMDPQLMYEFTRDLGPIDWRHGQAHALYWSRRGSMFGEVRVNNDDDIYKIINNDRVQMQAMQDLARYGRISFDPFSQALPSRFPEPRWVDTIAKQFSHFYGKHYNVRGGGGETFIAFLQNFIGSSIREAYRSGERERAQRLLDLLNDKFGAGSTLKNPKYMVGLDAFVANEIKGEYSFQPHVAPSEAVASLRYAFRVGIGQDRPEVYRQAMQFVDSVIKYFRGNDYNDYVTRFGEGRMKDLLAQLGKTKEVAFEQLMRDTSISLQEKATIWTNVDELEPTLRLTVYDRVAEPLRAQFARNELSAVREFDEIFPAPPGLEAWRMRLAAERKAEEEAAARGKARDDFQRK